MKRCAICKQSYPDDIEYCPLDGVRLDVVMTDAESLLAAGIARRFRILRRLGHGGMGTVYLAEQVAVGNRHVALKVLNRSLLDNPQFQMRFRTEAASTGRIRHLNVVSVYESGQADDGTPYIAMEYLEGETLRDALKKGGALSVTETGEILLQVARGLNAAHKLGIIHRDLKPDNIFLTYGDEGELIVKIVDFGIAKLRESVTQTLAGTVLGTPAYMSAEQASGLPGDQLDARADVYSLGIVVYEMLSGRVPFESSTPLGYLRKHMMDEPPALRSVAPDLPVSHRLEAVVLKALKKEREERFAGALEFARAFAAAAEDLPAPEAAGALPATNIVSPAAGWSSSAPLPQAMSPSARSDVAVQTPPPAPPRAPATPRTPLPVRAAGASPAVSSDADAPHFRIVTEPSGQAKYIAAGVVFLVIVAAVVWYFSQSASRSGPGTTSLPGAPPTAVPKMITIPGATFTMGSNDVNDPESNPAHPVSVAAFSLDRKPVSSAQYAEFVKSTGHAAPDGWTNNSYPAQQADWPVTGVSWDDAKAYCTAQGLRLPTEAEWEYAARGTDARLYPWGNNFSPALTNSLEAALGRPEAVGSHRDAASPFGILDMSGNVWQWTADAYQPYPGHKSPFAIPADAKVIRGGSYEYEKLHVTTTSRNLERASRGSATIGFRCAK